MLGRANDDIPTKLVAMVYPKPPHAIYVLKDSGISKPKDFEGKTLADTAFSSVPKLFATYAKAAGFDAEQGEVDRGEQRRAARHADDQTRRRHRPISRSARRFSPQQRPRNSSSSFAMRMRD